MALPSDRGLLDMPATSATKPSSQVHWSPECDRSNGRLNAPPPANRLAQFLQKIDDLLSNAQTPAFLRLGFLLLFVLPCGNAWAAQWVAVGPDGGDARSLAYDLHNPDHMFLGTSTGTIFQSTDGGRRWTHFAQLGTEDEFVADQIVIDPQNSQHMYVGAWSVHGHNAGELFCSHDGGKSWTLIPAMHRKSIRAVSVASSDPRILVVGALDGVYRSTDGGQQWHKISRRYSEIKNVESITIDPENPNVVYVGTWHLGWKTSDGGLSWHRVDEGIIDDSDIFSIIVDKSHPQTVFASACSGIYKSPDGGHRFERIQNIPFSARRSRVLKQDPNNPAVIYAGTTEGLWVTSDGGTAWKRVTSPDIVVNDILIDPRNSQRVLLATDRAGVLASDHGTLNFAASNSGFTHRYTSAILGDRENPEQLYVGVVNDRELGGVFVSTDGGQHWTQKSAGLEGRDVFVLKQTGDRAILAGTNHGIFVLPQNGLGWSPLNHTVEARLEDAAAKPQAQSAMSSEKVNDIEITLPKWLAATPSGLYVSPDQGKSWTKVRALGRPYVVAVESWHDAIVVATTSKVLVSVDHAKTWKASRGLPLSVNGIQSLTITPDGQIIIASRSGAFRGRKLGTQWDRMRLGLPGTDISSVTYDEGRRRLLATIRENTAIFESTDGGHRWHQISDTRYPLRRLSLVRGRLVAATRFDGLILETENDQPSRTEADNPSNR
jgi:photosystem II stability/assembly factor-like uncharacterized protein